MWQQGPQTWDNMPESRMLGEETLQHVRAAIDALPAKQREVILLRDVAGFEASDVYVSNAHGGAGNGSVSGFNVTGAGTLSSIGSSPFADAQKAPCWVEISYDGAYLWTVNTGSTTISSYRILADRSLSLVTSTAFKSGAGIRPFDARLSADGSTLYVVDAAIASQLSHSRAERRHSASSPTNQLTGSAGAYMVAAPYYAATEGYR
jgi:Lactonase, 7-bladed beta-propeller